MARSVQNGHPLQCRGTFVFGVYCAMAGAVRRSGHSLSTSHRKFERLFNTLRLESRAIGLTLDDEVVGGILEPIERRPQGLRGKASIVEKRAGRRCVGR